MAPSAAAFGEKRHSEPHSAAPDLGTLSRVRRQLPPVKTEPVAPLCASLLDTPRRPVARAFEALLAERQLRELAMIAESDRISASDALDTVESRLGGRAAAKASLAEMLRDGKLHAHASRSWCCDVRDVDIAWDSRNEDGGEWDVDISIDQDFWRDSVQWTEDVELWRWPECFFVITQRKRPLEIVYFEGVSFARPDIDRLMSGHKAVDSPKGKGGRRPDLERWEWFWLEVVQMARDGNLVFGGPTSQEDLCKRLLIAMQDRYPSERPLELDSIKPRVRRIWERFCER
jgi:hypothetical protein